MRKVQRKRKDTRRLERTSTNFLEIFVGGVVGVGVGVVVENRERIAKLLQKIRYPAATVQQTLPPTAADFLLCLFLSRHNRQQTIGDLTEEFHEDILPKFGVRAAQIWYWKKALGAIMERNPISRRILVGSGLLKVGEWIWKSLAG